jgi:hypothetical protein
MLGSRAHPSWWVTGAWYRQENKLLDLTQALADTRCVGMLEPEYRLGATTIAEDSAERDESVSSFGWGQWSTRIESIIEHYPWPTLLLALGLGYLLARRLR